MSRRISFSAQQFAQLPIPAAAEGSALAAVITAVNQCIANLYKLPCVPGERRTSMLPKDVANKPVEQRASAGKPDDKPLSDAMLEKVKTLFAKLDANGDGTVTKSEAQAFWKKNWANVNAQAMFNEVDDDGNGEVTYDEWLEFWQNVLAQPDYQEEDVLEELDSMIEGGSWVDWNDGRTT